MTINTPFPPRPPSFPPWEEPDGVRRESPERFGLVDAPVKRCKHCGATLISLKGDDESAKLMQRLLEGFVRLWNRAVAGG